MTATLTEIDDLTRPDHSRLNESDECHFIAEYTARGGYAFSQTNDLILNLKKSVLLRDQAQYRYKENAILEVGQAFREAVNPDFVAEATLVPIPPSKCKSDPEYDDRLVRILKAMNRGREADIRELIVQTITLPSHHSGASRSPEVLLETYEIDEELVDPTPRRIALFDDMLTTGSHFRAASKLLLDRFPDAEIIGIFYARRAIGSDI